MTQPDSKGFRRAMVEFYDVFVDWDARLAHEVPGIVRRLESAGARRVLDVGCGTGRHVQALRSAGYEVHGADASEPMLSRASELLGGEQGLHHWSLDEPLPASLVAAGPFDVVISVGNVWPQIAGEEVERAAAASLRQLLEDGGTLLLAFKAVADRVAQKSPYLPLLRRELDGRPIWFVRFLDLEAQPLADGTPLTQFRMIALDPEEVLAEEISRWRVWKPDELEAWWKAAGFDAVRVTGGLGTEAPPGGEDVLVIASSRVALE